MGRVYVGWDLVLEREVAIKTLQTGADAERFVTEARITARLPHPGIPPVHAFGVLADGTPYLVMKRIHGQTLGELLKQRAVPQEHLSTDLQIFEQIAQAVGFAHQRGVIHRDLKPANVMVGEFGEVQVMDWGIAKSLSKNEERYPHERVDAERSRDTTRAIHTQAGTIMGTPGFMAPEQARGEAVDTRTDVFALGSILCVLLTGKPAFVGRTDIIERTARGELADAQQRLADCSGGPNASTKPRRCTARHSMHVSNCTKPHRSDHCFSTRSQAAM
jgi:serine/threonine protein kinase